MLTKQLTQHTLHTRRQSLHQCLSVLILVPVAFVADAVAGKKTAGVKTWGAKQGGVGYTTTGGYVKGLTVKIDAVPAS